MDSLAAATALDGLALEREHFRVAENTSVGLLRLQTFHRRPDALEKLAEQLGTRLPVAGETVADQGLQWFWSAPGEWIIAVEGGAERELARSLELKLDGLFAVLSVITDSRVALDISGESAREVLARGSTVDFHPTRFNVGQCCTTRFAGTRAMIAQLVEGDALLLFADRSVAMYLLEWFTAASVDC